ncbi:MAG: hypothetical protein E7466_01740 [Ruminococcaceae bacterium]|nr:hypothetical protein [Oscillospiraceae bacterium]MBQ3215560.1 hypothetical protein [Oscillospiraceae bacterium]
MSKSKKLSTKTRVILIISLSLVTCLIIAYGIFYFAFMNLLSPGYEPDLVISSPDGKYELVVREWSYFHSCGSDIYIRETKWYNRWMVKEIGYTSSEDPCFADGHYYVEWESDKVTIYYYRGHPGVEDVNNRSTWLGIFSYELD